MEIVIRRLGKYHNIKWEMICKYLYLKTTNIKKLAINKH